MRLIDPSQRINVLWDSDDGTRYTEEMTIRRLLAVMSDDEVKTITITCCDECECGEERQGGGIKCNINGIIYAPSHFCAYGRGRRTDG